MQTWSEPWTGFRRTFGEFGDKDVVVHTTLRGRQCVRSVRIDADEHERRRAENSWNVGLVDYMSTIYVLGP